MSSRRRRKSRVEETKGATVPGIGKRTVNESLEAPTIAKPSLEAPIIAKPSLEAPITANQSLEAPTIDDTEASVETCQFCGRPIQDHLPTMSCSSWNRV